MLLDSVPGLTHPPPKKGKKNFNYSDITLTEDMTKILNRGLNFSIQPIKLNVTELLVNFQKFQRTIMWVEY